MFDDTYGWNDYYDTTDKSEGDPLGKFAENIGAARYEVLDGKKTDMILQSFFNVTPSHDDFYNDYYGEVLRLGGYYYQGKCYTTAGDGGDVRPTYSFDEKCQLADGSYELLLKLTEYDNPGKTLYLFKITAGLKDVNGTRMWSLKKIEKTTAEEFAAGAENKAENKAAATGVGAIHYP